MTFHYIAFRTFCHATESIDRVKDALERLAGEEMEIEESEAEGYYGNQIIVLEGKISRNREMDDFFDRLPKETIEDLLVTLERRIDERCNFHFRIDKGSAYEGEFKLSRGGNVIRVRARVESYPSRRETAIEKMEEYLPKRIQEEG